MKIPGVADIHAGEWFNLLLKCLLLPFIGYTL